MITLINVKKINNIIKANYYHESNENELGYVEYDINTGKLINVRYANGVSKEYGFIHLLDGFKLMVEYNKFPDKLSVSWY